MGDIYGDSVLMQYADQFTVPANHAGVPAISLPGGLSSEALPIGLQIIAPDFAEPTLFRAGYAFEQATANEAWRQAKPRVLVEAGL
jgi:aspartyl-tRNA(Asn)/glutamyl-tRNA(Gln) amidotransferase subunit A